MCKLKTKGCGRNIQVNCATTAPNTSIQLCFHFSSNSHIFLCISSSVCLIMWWPVTFEMGIKVLFFPSDSSPQQADQNLCIDWWTLFPSSFTHLYALCVWTGQEKKGARLRYGLWGLAHKCWCNPRLGCWVIIVSLCTADFHLLADRDSSLHCCFPMGVEKQLLTAKNYFQPAVWAWMVLPLQQMRPY